MPTVAITILLSWLFLNLRKNGTARTKPSMSHQSLSTLWQPFCFERIPCDTTHVSPLLNIHRKKSARLSRDAPWRSRLQTITHEGLSNLVLQRKKRALASENFFDSYWTSEEQCPGKVETRCLHAQGRHLEIGTANIPGNLTLYCHSSLLIWFSEYPINASMVMSVTLKSGIPPTSTGCGSDEAEKLYNSKEGWPGTDL